MVLCIKKKSMMQSVFSCHNMIMIRIIHFFNGSVVNNTLLRTEYNNIIFLYEYGLSLL